MLIKYDSRWKKIDLNLKQQYCFGKGNALVIDPFCPSLCYIISQNVNFL